ncbi:MAG: hypothetical protein NC483_05790, partial [Ruminococcus sp.]|nr:hypothetical protein [Ruminococcus sp.]
TNKNNKDSNARVYTDELGNHSFSGISKSSKCILYLDKINYESRTMAELLNTHYKYKSKRTVENEDFNVPYEETTYGMIFEGEDDDGTTYYFAGNPLDNWVEFGGYYWRIIRINGDSSIRIIYQGRTQDADGKKLEPQITGVETEVGTTTFNPSGKENAYVGYMYGTPGSSTYEATHENKNDSVIKQVVDNWFASSNIKQGTSYFNKIDLNAGFCGDRQSFTNTNGTTEGGGISSNLTFYGSHVRILTKNNPSFKCNNKQNDLYTSISSNQGNKKLTYPIGLITADEVYYAGLPNNDKTYVPSNYLITKRLYWTMSPSMLNTGNASVFTVDNKGWFSYTTVTSNRGARPVINLRSDVTFTGDGTQANPFKVV